MGCELKRTQTPDNGFLVSFDENSLGKIGHAGVGISFENADEVISHPLLILLKLQLFECLLL